MTRKFEVISGGRPDRTQCPTEPDINESVILTLPEDVRQEFEKRYAKRTENTTPSRSVYACARDAALRFLGSLRTNSS